MKNTRRWILRLLAVGVMGACLTGPAPGNVQGCGQSAPVADARTFCYDRAWWSCRRDNVFGRLSMEEFEACVAPIETRCSGFVWPTGCEPPQSQADACITLLRRPDFGPIPTEELLRMYSECNLCM